jgi:hypothetical protein
MAVSKFIDVHRATTGAEQPRQAQAADLAIQGEEGVDFQHAWAGPDSGVVYCLSEGPNTEAVQRIHDGRVTRLCSAFTTGGSPG